jgi:hypothetical protein
VVQNHQDLILGILAPRIVKALVVIIPQLSKHFQDKLFSFKDKFKNLDEVRFATVGYKIGSQDLLTQRMY